MNLPRLASPALVLANTVLWWAGVLPVTSAHAASTNVCSDLVVEVPADSFDTSRSPFLGRALGQTFFAPETVITKFTAWRYPNDRSLVGAHLFITAVDTTLVPPRPMTHTILLDGPTVTVYDSDPPGQFIEMPFVIDPPFVLPRPGLYAWFLQAADCNQGSAWNILGNDRNIYPYGIYWLSGRATGDCHLAFVDGGEDYTDLCFRIDFCHPLTPARLETWGGLKLLYR